MIIYAKLQSSRVRHQYGIFGGKSQTSFTRNATRAGSEEGRLFSQARLFQAKAIDPLSPSHETAQLLNTSVFLLQIDTFLKRIVNEICILKRSDYDC